MSNSPDLSLYDSVSNITNTKLSSSVKVSGSFKFTLPSNKSGKCVVNLGQSFSDVPFVSTCVSVTDGNPLEVSHSLGVISTSSFELHLCNSDMQNAVSGCVSWNASN